MTAPPNSSRSVLVEWVVDARRRTAALLEDLADDQLRVPSLEIINPPLWEAGHVAWFQEKWVLRHRLGRAPLWAEADGLYDSASIPHGRRWSRSLSGRTETIAYLTAVRDAVLDVLERQAGDADLAYLVAYSVFHEDMHAEASLYTRQTLGYRRPESSRPLAERDGSEARPGVPVAAGSAGDRDVEHAGGTFLLGAGRDQPFVFDNEKWAHEVTLAAFAISRTAVTQAAFAEFVDAGGYQRREFWSEAGWQWRARAAAGQPVYWRPGGSSGWMRRHFDQWLPLEPELPVMHVNWFEAEAWCRWARRRLPSEAEWELAASSGTRPGAVCGTKRRFPWGDEPPCADRANLDGVAGGAVSAAALPAGDGPLGCRQMIGNVWEWTASDFQPYPGFVADPYEEYSRPWFGSRKVLRGGAWATRSRLIRNTYRNFYTPDRRDVFAGFRTCAIQE